MPPSATGRHTTRLLAVVAVLLVVAAFKLSKPVTLPLCIAVFLIMLAWPLQLWLERRLPRWVAYVCTLAAVLAGAALIASAFVLAAERLGEVAPQLAERLQPLVSEAAAWARSRGLPVPERALASAATAERLVPIVGGLVGRIYSLLALLGLVLAFLLLGLLEVRNFQARVERRLRPRVGHRVVDTAALVAHKVRRFLLALTIASAISGALTGVYALALGLDLALTWGVLTFLLNYIPTIGPALAVIPPTVYALLQFEGLGRPAAVFLGVGAIQFFIGNFVDPKIEGRVLKLSPVLVLFSIVFWGWVWGVFGALLAVPLTVAIVLVCDQFDGTRWVGKLLTQTDENEEEEESPRPAQG